MSRSWDIGTGGAEGSSAPEAYHTRQISPAGDVHDAVVEVTEPDAAVAGLGTRLLVHVRLIADGEPVAECETSVSYGRG